MPEFQIALETERFGVLGVKRSVTGHLYDECRKRQPRLYRTKSMASVEAGCSRYVTTYCEVISARVRLWQASKLYAKYVH